MIIQIHPLIPAEAPEVLSAVMHSPTRASHLWWCISIYSRYSSTFRVFEYGLVLIGIRPLDPMQLKSVAMVGESMDGDFAHNVS